MYRPMVNVKIRSLKVFLRMPLRMDRASWEEGWNNNSSEVQLWLVLHYLLSKSSSDSMKKIIKTNADFLFFIIIVIAV